jgi:hypothetical protein
MESYQERVIKEKADLDSNIEKLDAFIGSELYEAVVDITDKYLLCSQLLTMKSLSSILHSRIKRF